MFGEKEEVGVYLHPLWEQGVKFTDSTDNGGYKWKRLQKLNKKKIVFYLVGEDKSFYICTRFGDEAMFMGITRS